MGHSVPPPSWFGPRIRAVGLRYRTNRRSMPRSPRHQFRSVVEACSGTRNGHGATKSRCRQRGCETVRLQAIQQYRRDGLTYDVRDAAPPDGAVVVLLHGFPPRDDSWDAVIERLTAGGYRCVAPIQRGYSPAARPRRRRDYRMTELVADVTALIDAGGAQRVHLV